MAEAKSFQAKIELMGKMHASLTGAIRSAQAQLRGLGNMAKKMGAGIGAAFGKLGAMAKSFAGQLIGVTLAFAGLRSASEFISKSIAEYRANAEAAAKLNAALENNPKLVKLGTAALEKQKAAFADLASQSQEGGIYAGGMWTEAYAALAQYGAGVKDASKLTQSMGDLLAKRKGFKATADDAKALANQIGLAVSSGKLGKLSKELGISDKEAKKFATGMKSAGERIDFLNKKIQGRAGGQQAALAGTDQGRIQAAQNTINDMQSRMGEGFQKIEVQWKEAVARMVPAMEPVFGKITEVAGRSMDAILDLMEDLSDEWEDFTSGIASPEFIAAWDKLKEVSDRVLKPIGEAIGPIITKITELAGFKMPETGMAGIIQREVEDVTKWINRIGKAIDWVMDLVEDMGDAFEDFMSGLASFKLPDWITNFKFPDLSQIALPTVPDFSKMSVPNLDFTAINTALKGVKDLIDEIAKLFTGWGVPGALMSGLTALGEKLGLVQSKAAAATSAFAGGGGGSAHGSGGGAEWQHGGMVNRPTFGVVGEAGPEAVIPLTGSRQRSMDLLNSAANALGAGRRSTSVNYAPTFTVNGGGPEVAHQIERIVRSSHDELLRQIEALDSEMMRRAFV